MPDQTPLGASPDPQQPPSWMEALPQPLRTLLALPRELPEADTFAIVVLSPVPFMVLAALFGGLAAWIAFLWIAVFIFLLDELLARPAPDAPEFPAADTLSKVLAGVHFALLFLAVWALSGGTYLGFGSKVLVFLSFGLFFGQVSNSNAHELIHRSDKRLFLLGKWIYTSLLFGHHTSAHRHVHHRFAATPNDPNSAELGEGFWSFAPRAWVGSFSTGWEMERNLRQRAQGGAVSGLRPYADYVLGGAGFALVVAVLFGAGGLLAYLLLCLYAQIQLLLSDYVQHYGLSRKPLGNGQYEPVNEAHSWDAPHPVSSLWMLNAPRHSDHHAHPSRVYPALRLGDTGAPGRPILPRSLPAMAALALVPPLWRRVMDHRVRALAKASR
ncbi:alkane 1-monooxygenase [Thioclava sp. A2]|uniref:alkane 1-monooxygenase n=1 Tax=Thioclava sp. FCG-A2 TaxID=3080562 RepID=UPI002953CE5F|nr:alkane 1-monooxygenase [Thioclava sp. A2]MDV7270125.1 alkane 1-monooxygenase [Thioclava sp. A2]